MKRFILGGVVLCMALYVQGQSVFNLCAQDTTTFVFSEDATLCELYGEIEADRVIGVNPGSITFSSQLGGLSSIFGRPAIVYENVVINGRLIIDNNLVFFNSNISLGPGAEINVDEGNHMISLRSNYFACNSMWRGITVTDGSSITFNTNKIEDAQYAISCDGSSNMYLVANTFNRNYIGVRNLSAASGMSTLLFTFMNNNLFTCTSALNSPYPGQTPTPELISFAGISLNHAVTTIGDPRYRNYFSKMQFGIHSTNSDMLISGCSFSDMIANGTTVNNGMGVFTDGGTAVFNTVFDIVLGIIGSSKFDRNEGGIIARGTNLHVRSADFQSNKNFGVLSYDNLLSQDVKLNSNTLLLDAGSIPFGLYVDRSIASSGVHDSITSNNLHQNVGSVGVTLIGTHVALDEALIAANSLYLDGNGDEVTGIHNSPASTHNAVVSSNIVTFEGSNYSPCQFYTAQGPNRPIGGCRIGIEQLGAYSGSMGHRVIFNTVTGGTGDFGLASKSQMNTLYCNNYFDSTRTGLLFLTDNTGTQLQGSSINSHHYGLWLHNAIIGPQIRADNRWSSDPDDYVVNGAFCDFMPEQSIFQVQSGALGIMPPKVIPLMGWFDVVQGDVANCSTDGNPNTSLSTAELLLLDGELSAQNADTSLIWDVGFELMTKIVKNPAILSSDSMVYAYYNTISNSATFKLAEYFSEYESYTIGDTNLLNALSDVNEEIQILLDSLRMIDILNSDQGDSLFIDSSYISEYYVVSNEIISRNATRDSIVAELDSIRENELSVLLSEVNSVEANGLFDQNKKFILRYKILDVLDELTQLEIDTLESIAYLCPEEYGNTITLARSHLPFCHEKNIARASDCEIMEELQLPDVIASHDDKLDVSIEPNPASSSVRIKFNNRVSGKIQIYNLQGKLITEVNVVESDFIDIDCSNISGGIYIIRFLDANRGMTQVSGKLVIQR